jgi:hypothetical protein
MQVTLFRDACCVFVEDETITMVEAKLGDDSVVLAAIGDAATELANYGFIHSIVEVESGLPPSQWSDRVYQAVREYRWDWGLTPDHEMLFATTVKIPQSQAA